MSEINANIQVTPISATFTVTQPTTTFTANATQLNIFAGTSPSAGGSNTNVQYNLLGKLAGSNGFSYNGITNTATLQNLLISNVANLGGTSNVKISGGLNDYVLATDGSGNLTWTSKGSQIINIQALSNANPIVMTVANTTPYINSTPITISNVAGVNANSIVNGQTFYVQLSNNYSSTGNVSLYTDSGLTTGANGFYLAAVANTGTAINYFNTSGSNTPGGTNTQVQFNDAGAFGGNAGFTYDKVTGNLNTPNNIISVGNITAPYFIGNITGTTGNSNFANYAGNVTISSQPNITNVGALTNLVVSGTTQIQQAKEKVTVSAVAATGTIDYDLLDQAIILQSANATANFTLNFRGNATTSLNSFMSVDQSMTATFINKNGFPAYYANVIKIDGNTVGVAWSNGTAPTGGTTNAYDSYTFNIVKTNVSTYVVFGIAGSYY